MTDAIQSDRNRGSPNGAHGETECLVAIGSITGILNISAISTCRSRVGRSPPSFEWTLRLRSGQAHETPVATLTNGGLRERPFSSPPSPHTINKNPHDENQACVSKKILARLQNKNIADPSHQRGYWIKPHPKRSRHIWLPHPEHNDSNDLHKKLQHDADYD